MPLDEVTVSVLDRSFLFGDAVYEVVRVYAGTPFLLGEHIQRLSRSLREISIVCDVPLVEERALSTLAHSGVSEAILYLHVTRGVAPRTHHFPEKTPDPNVLIYVKEIEADPYAAIRAEGARTILFDDLRWRRCDIKSVNLLANCLAAQAAHEAGCIEAILVGAQGEIIEGSHSSVFAVRGGTLITSPLEKNLLPGITRKLVVHVAGKAGISVREECINRGGLANLDEMFLTGTTTEVMPVVQVDQTQIGQGVPGPIAARLQSAYRHLAQSAPSFVPP